MNEEETTTISKSELSTLIEKIDTLEKQYQKLATKKDLKKSTKDISDTLMVINISTGLALAGIFFTLYKVW
ncbi:MAG: hypothetical protein DHS20C07_19270 [Methyloligella sp.]|nr:MAG: hypothetical protein DHS20C07_19270 [Methyloligella sp.]